MKIVSDKNKLIKFVNRETNLGFVPTMGAIHLGHISLIKKSKALCNVTIVSIFINKPQFNRKNDFKKYPRTLAKDIKMLKKLKIDYLYLPKFKQIYPKGINKKIKISSFGNKLCGKHRPGHFKAIADVIDRFIKIIKPHKIFFGEKDMQQLKIIEHYVMKNFKKIKVIGCETVRDKNGVALSSRNFLLTKNEKEIASRIYKLIKNKKNLLIKKKLTLNKIKNKIIDLGANKIDYLKIIDINKLIKPFSKKINYKIFIAYYLGSTRLIDNI